MQKEKEGQVKKTLSILALLASLLGGIWAFQNTKSVQFAWDPMPAGDSWREVRLYDISTTPETLLGTVVCSTTCPTTLTIVQQKRAYQVVARSWDGTWESGNSNVVTLAGPPSAPGNLKRN